MIDLTIRILPATLLTALITAISRTLAKKNDRMV
mgnify:CR=1 FL=1